MDFTALTTAMDSADLVTAIGAAALVMFGPTFAKWGYRKLISFFGR